MKSFFARKLIKYILFTISSIILFQSCDSGQENAARSKTIKFWHFWSEPNQKKTLLPLIEEFEKANACTVEVTELSWGDGKTKLLAAFNSGTAPDVLELGSDWVAQFSGGGVLFNLDSSSINMDQYIDFSHKPSYWRGELFAVPWLVDTRALFYNKTLLGDRPMPDNIEGLRRLSDDINQMDNVYGFGANGSDRHRLYKKIVTFFWSNGGKILDEKGKPVINSPQNINALRQYVALARTGIIETQRQIDALFARGKIGFWISGGWLLEKIKNENPGLNFGVAQIPNFGDRHGVSFAGGEYLAVSKQSGNKELAVKLIKYLTGGGVAIRFCKQIIEAGFPADKNYFNDPYYKTQKFREVFSRQLQSARMTPVHPKWLDIEAIIENAAVEALLADKSPKDALDDAQAKLMRLLR